MGLIKIQENAFHRIATVDAKKYPEVFNGELGKLPGRQTLKVKKNTVPVIMPVCRVSVNTRSTLLTELTRLEKLKVITKVSEPTPWLSQLMMTHKKDESVCICIDPNELNKALLRERFTMPVMEDILHEQKQIFHQDSGT